MCKKCTYDKKEVCLKKSDLFEHMDVSLWLSVEFSILNVHNASSFRDDTSPCIFT